MNRSALVEAEGPAISTAGRRPGSAGLHVGRGAPLRKARRCTSRRDRLADGRKGTLPLGGSRFRRRKPVSGERDGCSLPARNGSNPGQARPGHQFSNVASRPPCDRQRTSSRSRCFDRMPVRSPQSVRRRGRRESSAEAACDLNAAETQSVSAFASLRHLYNLRDQICPSARVPLSTSPPAIARTAGQRSPRGAYQSNTLC